MITDLANLGGSLRGTTDLGAARAKDSGNGMNAPSGKPGKASSFDQILQNQAAAKNTAPFSRSDKGVKANSVERESAPAPATGDRVADSNRSKTNTTEAASSKNEPRTAQRKNNWEEPGSVQEERSSEKVGKKTNSSSQNREQVMLEFMDSMESEFGIPPQRLVEAMTDIPQSEQLSSPEDSASQVIAQLELPKEQEQKAFALYMGMLAQLNQSARDFAPADPGSNAFLGGSAAAAAAMTAPVVLTAHEKRAALNESLDAMNQKFFVDNRSAMNVQTGAADLSSNLMSKSEMSNGALDLNQEMLKHDMASATYARAQKPGALPGIDSLPMQSLDPNSPEARQLAQSLAGLSAAAAALDQGLKSDPANLQALKAEQALGDDADNMSAKGLSGANGKTALTGSSSGAALVASGLSASDTEDGETDAGGGNSSQPDFMVSHAHGDSKRSDSVKAGDANTAFGATMAGIEAKQAGRGENEANIRQIMNQAQYLIKKGGGETKIQMAPEGIGQVHLKLAVHEGKVNLEMSAETKEAKKLLESSLSELKSQLSHHNLTVDKVKVDVGNQLANENRNPDSQNQQRQMDMRQDSSRNQARDFWNEFQGGQDRRQGFFETPAIRAYGSRSPVDPLTPTSPGAAAQRAYAGSGKGRGLNLVA